MSNTVPVIQGMFEQTANGARLCGSKCSTCGSPYFPRTAACHNPACDESRVEDAAFGPRGKLWSFAVQYYAPPAPVKYDEPFQPFAMGAVDLPEGLRVLGRIAVDDLKKVKIGMDVELVIDPLCTDKDGNKVVSWKFRPL